MTKNLTVKQKTQTLLINGILTPKKIPKIKDAKHKVVITIQANFTKHEVNTNLEVQEALQKIEGFYRCMEVMSENTDYKFVRRLWLMRTIVKEIDSVMEKIKYKKNNTEKDA
jgi:hypothetical protein